MARVWRAWDPSLQCYVALKEPLFDPRHSPEVLEEIGRRFVREAQVGARLRGHPGIVTVYAADVYDGRPAVAMELVEGATLGDILENGPLDPATALDVLDQLLDAVGYAHSLGIVHRDLKPDNIFVDKSGRVKVADFGIAGVSDPSYVKATVVGVVLGTPGYMSPEQAMGGSADARSDLFSIGAIAYEMVTGRNPFGVSEGADSTKLLYRIVHEPTPALSGAVGAALPQGFQDAVMAALSKRPDDRPIDAATMKAMLHGAHAGGGPGIGMAAGAAAAGAAAGAAGAAGVAAASPAGTVGGSGNGTLVMPVDTSFAMPLASGAAARWVPIIAIAAVCVILLVGAVVATPSAGGGSVGGGVASAPSAATGDGVRSSDSSAAAGTSVGAGSSSSSSASSSGSAPASPSPSSGASSEDRATSDPAPASDSGAADSSESAIAPVVQDASPIAEPVEEGYYEDASGYGYAPDGTFWGVWIAAYSDMDDAYACSDEANSYGLPVTVYEIPDANGTYYVVSAGEFATRSEADAVVARAQSLGYYDAYTSTAEYL